MKNKLTVSASILLWTLLASLCAKSQAISNYQSIEVRGGKSFSSSDYAAVKYRHTTSTMLDVATAVFLEAFQNNGLHFSNYGLDLTGEYYTPVGDNTDHAFEVKLGLGITANAENEPWILKAYSFSKRLNYGVIGELAGEWCVSQNFSLTAFVQQKYLFNKLLGNTRFIVGIGIKLNLDN